MTVLSMTFSNLNAQQGNPTLKGKVTDEAGKPLPGVTVKLKGSKGAVTTNEIGEFNISIPENGNKTLEISYVGMQSQEVKVDRQQNLAISLAPAVSEQQEVIVVGYGTQKKQAITGAVVQADLKTYEKVPVNNIMETLKGTVAGLNVGEANKAGAVPDYTIRGKNTIAASSAPLIVLDGVIFSGSMADIAPSDIESVTVLKDASAAAIYGARSANGVILIESKKGKSVNGKPKFEVSANLGSINELNPLKLYDANGYMQHLYDFLIDNGTNLTFDQTPNYLQTIEKKNYDATPDHAPTLADPYGPFRQTGHNLNATASVSQRTDKMSYYLSGSMVDQKGVIVNDDFKHYSLRLNLESKVTSWLTLGFRSYYSFRDYPGDRIYGSGAGSSSPYLFSPYASLYNTDGSYNMYPANHHLNGESVFSVGN
jgi:TonB-dependent SusC/RagA subfamily outer membrane receptor